MLLRRTGQPCPLTHRAARRVAGGVSPETAPVINRHCKTSSTGTGSWPERPLALAQGAAPGQGVCHILEGGAHLWQEPRSLLLGGTGAGEGRIAR